MQDPSHVGLGLRPHRKGVRRAVDLALALATKVEACSRRRDSWPPKMVCGSFVKNYGSGKKDRDAGLPGQHGSRRRQLARDTRNASVWPLECDPAEGASGGGKSDLDRRERQSKDSGHNAHARSTRHRGPRSAAERGACRDHKDPKHQLHARTIGPVPTTIAARSTGVGYTSGCLRRRFLSRNSVLSTLPGQKLGKSSRARSR